MLGLQPLQRGIEQVAVGDGRSDVADGRAIERRQLDLDRAATSPPDDVNAGPEHQTVRSHASKRSGSRSARQAPPGGEEPFLDRVSRELVVPEDQAGCRVQPRDERAGKHGEGVMIASPGPLDELSLVHDHPL